MTQFYRTLPEDLSEAARVDGASAWRIFLQLILPRIATTGGKN